MDKIKLLIFTLLIALLFSCATTKTEEKAVSYTAVETKEEIILAEEETKESIESTESSVETPQTETETDKTPINKRDNSDVITLFNYAYGVKTATQLESSGVSLIASYFVRGLYDATVKPNSPSFINIADIPSIVNEFISTYLDNGLTFDSGTRPEYLEDILALSSPSDIPSLFSYAYGFNIMRSFVMEEIDIDILSFMTGVLDTIYSEEKPMSDSDLENAVNSYVLYLNEEYYRKLEEQAENNKIKAEAFLLENSLLDGITVLENGVEILLLDEDETIGNKPTEYDTVIMDYNEYILNYETGELEFTDADYYTEVSLFNLSNGLRSAIAQMHTGQAVRIFIPPELSRLIEGDGDTIPPYSIFVYDVALHEIL